MKHIWIIMFAAAAFAVTQQAEKPAEKKAPPKAAVRKAAPKKAVAANKAAPAKKPDPMALPAGAQEIAPNQWRVTDEKGQKWLYYKTPFGFSKALESSQVTPVETVPEDWTAKDEGDSVTFERPTPFGKNVWTRKKSDLTETESAVFKRSQGGSK